MRLRWSQEAADDLERIADYLFAHTPTRAERITRTLYHAPTRLLTAPYSGRPGKKGGTRELVVTSLPYIIVYVVSEPRSAPAARPAA